MNLVDLTSLTTELQIRGFGQEMIDTAFRCLVHVYAVQDFASDNGGILVEDILNTYPMEVVQAASEIFLEKGGVGEYEIYRVRWGCEEAALTMEGQLWDYTSLRWNEYVSNLNERYLGFFLPPASEIGRVVTTWKLRKDLKWFSIAIPRHGWNILRLIDDLTAIAWKLDLAFGFRPYGPEGVKGEQALLHEQAFEALRQRAVLPPEEYTKGIRLWRFFSEYDANATDFVTLMKESDLALEDVVEQVNRFFDKGLTSRYREGQYPPYFVNDKKKKEFQEAVRGLLTPFDSWLSHKEVSQEGVSQSSPPVDEVPSAAGRVLGPAQLMVTRQGGGHALI
jgi:hypothetical protein